MIILAVHFQMSESWDTMQKFSEFPSGAAITAVMESGLHRLQLAKQSTKRSGVPHKTTAWVLT